MTVIPTIRRSLLTRLKARLHVAYLRWLIRIYEDDDAAIDREWTRAAPGHALMLSIEQDLLRKRLAALRIELAIAETEC